jgi:transporter family protein
MHIPLWLVFALLALVFFGLTGITQKLATNEISTELSYIWFCVAMLVVAIFIFALAPLDWHVRRKIIALAIAGGVLNGFGAMTSFKALEVGGNASIVVPLCYLYPLVAIFLAVVFLHEKLTGTAIAGIALAVVAAFLLSQESTTEPPADGEGPLP